MAGRRKFIAFIEDPAIIEKILSHLDTNAPGLDDTRRPPVRTPVQRGPFDKMGYLRKPGPGYAASGAAIVFAGSPQRNDPDRHPANPSTGLERC